MTERSFRKSLWIEIGVLLTLLTLAVLWVTTPRSMAQQDNRQLRREQTKANGADLRRLALVIGNGAYKTVPPLKNPPNDALLLAATLKKLGFEVTIGTDKSQREMKQLIREFGQRLRGGGGVGLFYFAGHGVQSRGHNYLIPVDADIQTEADLEDVAVDVNYVLNMMDDAQNALNIAILDACRNNPFARSFRSAQEGLAQVKAPTGTLIAYATSPDSVAADGGGANSPYAEELTKQIQTPGVLLETMFRRVAEQVSLRSGGRQEPWYSANVKGEFFFSNAPTKIESVDVEREYWETIRASNDPQDYKDYLQAYPNGAYIGVARAKIRQLETARTTKPPPKSFRNQQGIEMVYIPAGRFMMGSTNGDPNGQPMHEVTISQAFYIGKYEVTQAQWQAVMKSSPNSFRNCGSNCPVETVSWDDAQAFIDRLNEANDGYMYRLPSEAEWEYACRAGTTGDYYAPNADDIGWSSENSGNKTHAVGAKQSNAFGLYDMSGNVWEWCRDWSSGGENGSSIDGDAGLNGAKREYRVMRGGSWINPASNLRSAISGFHPADLRKPYVGFRIVAVARTSESAPANTQPSNSGGSKTNDPLSVAKTNTPPAKSFKSQQGIEMVYVPPGKFMMGGSSYDSEKPAHNVTISQSFYMGKYEVTQSQWQAVMGNNPSFFKNCSDCPVENVSWSDAQDFINRLNEANDGYKYRLPSEAEWEYACRAGTTGDYYAADVDDIGWHADNSGKKLHAGGGKQPNAFGLYDMSGNVWEWCRDWYHENYDGAPTDGSAWLSGGAQESRVLRGGSLGSLDTNLRSASRSGNAPGSPFKFTGFRIVAVARNGTSSVPMKIINVSGEWNG